MDYSALPSVPITHRTADSFGLTARHVRRAVELGLLRAVLRGVYVRADVCVTTSVKLAAAALVINVVRADVCVTTSVKLAAAALVINESAVACDRTAAWIWGVDVHEFRELDTVPPVETFVLRGRHRSEREGIAGGSRDLVTTDWVEIEGVKVTTPLRTAMDLGCILPRRSALAAMDALMRGHGFAQRDMSHMLPRYFRRRGVIQLRELVPLVDPRAESQPESWTRLELVDNGLPIPELQWWVNVDGVPTYRLDLAYPHAKVAVEYDGEDTHSSPEDRQHDEVRRAWLRAHGWVVIVVTRSDFLATTDRWWVGEVVRALRQAQAPTRRHYQRHP